MISRILSCAVLLLAASVIPAAIPAGHKSAARRADRAANARVTPQPAEVERGRYLVEEVAKCQECHTPRDANGQLDHSRWLQGAPIWILPVHPDQNWAERAPALAGFPGLTEAQGERVLENGVGPNGLPIRPPMHVYHLKHDDAVAIIAYLQSLSPGSSPE